MPDTATGLAGRIHATFARCDGRTVARVTEAAAPLEFRGPLGDGEDSRFYLRNISCGVFAGDTYDISLVARDNSRAYVAATSATKVHAMPNSGAASTTRLESSPGSAIAYYDGPTILQADSDLTQRVELVTGGGVAIYAEVLIWGRLARSEILDFRRYRSELIIRDEGGCALFVERYELRPDASGDDLASMSLPVLGKVIVAGPAKTNPFDCLASRYAKSAVGFDELPSGAGYVLRIAGDQMESVAHFVERAVWASLPA